MSGDATGTIDQELPGLAPDVVEGYRNAPATMIAEIIDGALSLLPRPRLDHARSVGELHGELRGPFDGDPAIAWNESEHRPGDGSWIAAAFPTTVTVERLEFATGHDFNAPRYGDVFPLNSHLRRVRVTFDGGHAIERDVAADERVVVLEGLHTRARALRIEALSVWPGTRWATFCISEIAIAGHP